VQAAQEVVVHLVGVGGGTVAPAGAGGLGVAEDADGGADVEPLGQGGEDLPDALGRGLEAVEGGAGAGAQGVAAGLAAEALDVVRATATPIRDEGMDRGVGNAVVGAGQLAAGVALGRDPPRGTTPALPLRPRRYRRRWVSALERASRAPTV
jgi:hypothetical protein